MLTAYERRLLAFYLANAASRLHHRDREAFNLAKWASSRANRAAFGRKNRRLRTREADPAADEGMTAREWRNLQDALREECSMTEKMRYDRAARRLRRLGKSMGLTRTDLGVLELGLRYHIQPIIESMVDDVFRPPRGAMTPLNIREATLPTLLGISANTIHRRLRKDAPLIRSGLVSIDSDGDLNLVNRLYRLATVPSGGDLDVHRLLLDAASPGELEWRDFDHVASDRDHVERLLKSALESGVFGVNVLLYGAPGTGKTQFCKAMAERLGVTLYSVGETDEEGDEPRRGERLQELQLAQRLLARHPASLVLFDEMEDLLSGGLLSDPIASIEFFGRTDAAGFGFPESTSKVFMHRLLEQAPAPTLWTMNNARQVSPAMLRRMMFALELRPPTARVRERIWTRQLERHGIEAAPDDVRSLAAEFDVTPGVATGAIAAAQLSGGDIETVRCGVRSLSRLLSCGTPPQRTPAQFDPGLIQADTDPTALADCLADSGERRFSLCLQGPPGTGKSAYVRYLADHLGLEVLQKRASGLMSMWVGETEQRIAAAFADARDTGAFLVFDEADSLLADRRFAKRSWEVSQVNEMLTWMESHLLPFACTTNCGEHLDPATLRRFVFKVTLDYLAPAQTQAAFRGYFGLAPPTWLSALTALTPGDFAVVRRKAEVLGQLQDPEALATMLRAECDAKPDRPRAIGFRP